MTSTAEPISGHRWPYLIAICVPRFSRTGTPAAIRSPYCLTYCFSLVILNTYIGVGYIYSALTAAAGCHHDRSPVQATGRSILPFDDVRRRRSPPLHLPAMGRLVPLVSFRQRHPDRALSTVADASADVDTWSTTTREVAQRPVRNAGLVPSMRQSGLGGHLPTRSRDTTKTTRTPLYTGWRRFVVSTGGYHDHQSN